MADAPAGEVSHCEEFVPSPDATAPKRQVFISYASQDKAAAVDIAEALRAAGLFVWNDARELQSGDSIAQWTGDAISSSDVLLVLLSRHSVSSRWVQAELNAALARELNDRAVTVIPALLEDCDVPVLLSNKLYLDLRRDRSEAIKRLVERIRPVPNMDFAKLDGRTFEEMVGELLASVGFSVQRTVPLRDEGYDFIASHRSRDPFGVEQIERWLVEVKLYRDARVSVNTLKRLLGVLAITSGSKRGLVVTNGRLTSVARSFLADAEAKSGYQIRVIDATELTNLLIQHPEVSRKYFAAGQSNG